MPVVYGYQVADGRRKPDVVAYFRDKLKQADLKWGELFQDSVLEHYRAWFERDAGDWLLVLLRKGDHIVVPTLADVFRCSFDASLLEILDCRRNVLHVIELGIDSSTEVGRQTLRAPNSYVGLQYLVASTRSRAALALNRRHGRPTNNHAPYGYRILEKGRKARFVPDHQERDQCRLMVQLHDVEGLTFDKLFFRFLKHRIRRRGNREWARSSIHCGYHAAKKGFPGPRCQNRVR